MPLSERSQVFKLGTLLSMVGTYPRLSRNVQASAALGDAMSGNVSKSE